MVGGGSVIIAADSIDSIQTRRDGGLIIRTKQGGNFSVLGDIDDVTSWLNAPEEVAK
jgi:hypothetical protein